MAYDGERGVHRAQHLTERASLRFDSAPLFDERPPLVEARIVQRPLDLVEREPKLALDQELLQPQQVGIGVEPVAGLGASCHAA